MLLFKMAIFTAVFFSFMCLDLFQVPFLATPHSRSSFPRLRIAESFVTVLPHSNKSLKEDKGKKIYLEFSFPVRTLRHLAETVAISEPSASRASPKMGRSFPRGGTSIQARRVSGCPTGAGW